MLYIQPLSWQHTTDGHGSLQSSVADEEPTRHLRSVKSHVPTDFARLFSERMAATEACVASWCLRMRENTHRHTRQSYNIISDCAEFGNSHEGAQDNMDKGVQEMGIYEENGPL
ncbi:predicted protein [Plenodomus lingam JN3]|uniref:Predicted protein n=1 Tax=Leptosphaeria maculans (strain JN3 / isolate v23.1.3 / race Av1-4-5-6-7-8) TaxID=985895 RepID=E4ZUQ5_LEPMJ|nr:predicted protein [Plenodomus lingam JN3]CBX95134.1 predicted protein [Plenodomus lingam JN3]